MAIARMPPMTRAASADMNIPLKDHFFMVSPNLIEIEHSGPSRTRGAWGTVPSI